MATVEDLAIEREIAVVEENARLHGWAFDRVGPRCFRVSLTSKSEDTFQLEVECDQFPDIPPAIHWRNQNSGALDELADSPNPYNYFHDSGRICAPWNRLASTEGGPHLEWKRANWRQQPETKATVSLAAMILRIHHELRSDNYKGRRG